MNPFVDEILERAAEATDQEKDVLRVLLSVPPEEHMGDYALPCFMLGKKLQRARRWANSSAPFDASCSQAAADKGLERDTVACSRMMASPFGKTSVRVKPRRGP